MRSHDDALHKSSRHGIQRPSPAPCGRVRHDHLFGRAILDGPIARRPRSVPFPLFSIITVCGRLNQFAGILGRRWASCPGRRLTIAATCPTPDRTGAARSRRSHTLWGWSLGDPSGARGDADKYCPQRLSPARRAPPPSPAEPGERGPEIGNACPKPEKSADPQPPGIPDLGPPKAMN